jgi:hypothetical protein
MQLTGSDGLSLMYECPFKELANVIASRLDER